MHLVSISNTFELGAEKLDTEFAPIVKIDGEVVNNYTVKDGNIVFDTPPVSGNITVDFRDSSIVTNCYIDKNTGEVVINVDSPRAWWFIVGHEITHVLEGTESYGELQKALFAFAESRGELASRKAALTELYKGMNADIDAELTADLVGDYLFTDKDFINKLTGNRTVFQKVWDEVKYLCKVATGKELTEIEKVEREFAKAWKGYSTTGASEDGDVRYSISPTLNQDLDLVLNGKFAASKGEVYLGETSNFMTDVIGAESLKVTMPASKAYAAMVTRDEYEKNPFYPEQDNYHGIGKDDFIEILEKSENPIAAFADTPDENGNDRYNRIVLVTDKIIPDVENGGEGYAVVIEEVDTKASINGKRFDVNKTITVYPRAQIAEDINRAIADGRILDIKTKKDQLFAGVRGANSQAAIRKTDLANNIAHFWANVKWENEKNKIFSAETTDGMTEMQAALMKAGLIDADGHIQSMQDSENDSSRKNSLSYTDEAYPIRGDFATPMSDIRYTAPTAEATEDIAPLPASPVTEAATAQTPSTPPSAPTPPKASGQPAKVANNILRAGMNFYNLINIENKKPVTFVTG